MLFTKKYIICTIKCIDKNMLYGTDEYGRNKSWCDYKFKFIEPENYKKLYICNENANLYQIDKLYKAKFNEKDNSFNIIKEC